MRSSDRASRAAVLLQTLVGLFGCVLDFLSEIRPWITGDGSSGGSDDVASRIGSELAPSAVDLWALQRLGLECSRVLGVWVAEDPESLPQRFLDALPVLLALGAAEEVRAGNGSVIRVVGQNSGLIFAVFGGVGVGVGVWWCWWC